MEKVSLLVEILERIGYFSTIFQNNDQILDQK